MMLLLDLITRRSSAISWQMRKAHHHHHHHRHRVHRAGPSGGAQVNTFHQPSASNLRPLAHQSSDPDSVAVSSWHLPRSLRNTTPNSGSGSGRRSLLELRRYLQYMSNWTTGHSFYSSILYIFSRTLLQRAIPGLPSPRPCAHSGYCFSMLRAAVGVHDHLDLSRSLSTA